MKKGRLTKYTSKSERDKFLKKEIASIEAYEVQHQEMIEEAKATLDTSKNRLQELEQKEDEVAHTLEDRRDRLKTMSDQLAGLKNQFVQFQEQRKWVECGIG